MRLIRPTYTKALPPGARLLKRKAGTFVQFAGRGGRVVEAKLSADGQRVLIESRRWQLVFTDTLGVERRVNAFEDKGASQRLASLIQDALDNAAVGAPLPEGLQETFEALPEDVRDDLVKAKVLEQRKPRQEVFFIEDLVKGFEGYLRSNRERSHCHVRQCRNALRRIFGACKFITFADIDAEQLETHLLGLREEGKGISKRTYNGHVQVVKQFAKWAIQKAKAAKNSPVDSLCRLDDPDTDQRRVRRAMTPDEQRKLLATTEASSKILHGLDGRERAMLYRFALETGLRANEIRQLRAADLRLDAPEGAHLIVQAGYSKHRTTDRVPIRPDLALALRIFLGERGRIGQARVFKGNHRTLTSHTSTILTDDLRVAGIAAKNDAGEILDFHSLRHTFCTSLRFVKPRIAQKLARHKSETMTARYTHPEEADMRAALETMPSLSRVGMTGTEGQ